MYEPALVHLWRPTSLVCHTISHFDAITIAVDAVDLAITRLSKLSSLRRADMLIHKSARLELLERNVLGAIYPSKAVLRSALVQPQGIGLSLLVKPRTHLCAARALKALRHVPLGGRVEERDVVPQRQAAGSRQDLPPLRRAGVQAHLGTWVA